VLFTRQYYALKLVEITGMKPVSKIKTGLMTGEIHYSINAEISPYIRLEIKLLLVQTAVFWILI
jgi:hypothetical protein